jgi:hypothetical protein
MACPFVKLGKTFVEMSRDGPLHRVTQEFARANRRSRIPRADKESREALIGPDAQLFQADYDVNR